MVRMLMNESVIVHDPQVLFFAVSLSILILPLLICCKWSIYTVV